MYVRVEAAVVEVGRDVVDREHDHREDEDREAIPAQPPQHNTPKTFATSPSAQQLTGDATASLHYGIR